MHLLTYNCQLLSNESSIQINLNLKPDYILCKMLINLTTTNCLILTKYPFVSN